MSLTTASQAQEKLIQSLSKKMNGEFHADFMTRGIFATDASIYMQQPLAVATPRNREELSMVIQAAAEHGIPVLPRAGGTSLAGQTTGENALVADVSKHMDKVLDLDRDGKTALVEPGVIRDRLNAEIASSGLMFAPETSTSNRANIAGMMGNNSSGMMSIRYGKTIDHILGAEAILPDGTITWFGKRSEMDERGCALLDELLALVDRHRNLIEAKFPKVMRRVGGYSLDEFLGDDPNLAKILVGAEGTLGMVSKIKINLVDKPKAVLGLACHFKDFLESLRAVPTMIRHNPLSAEFMDGALIKMCVDNPNTKDKMSWLVGEPEAVIPIEMDGETAEECIAKLEAIEKDLRDAGYGYHITHLYTPEQVAEIKQVRMAGLGVMLKMIGDTKAISFIEDACVPVDVLADYAGGIVDIVHEEGLDLMTYGHASVGVLHLKPVVNLKTQEDREKCARISRKAMELCRQYGGSWSGEHGDGIARGAENDRFWGPEMIEVFRETKRIFDPQGIMNPGKIFDTPPVMEPLRYTHSYQKSNYDSMFHFREDGGFQGAVEMCNGVGACRKVGTGTMCPSYMATRNERDTTRGRANGLRLALAGQLDVGKFPSKELYEVLDLCLECKACKTECPSNVDMARMKSEFLHAFHKKYGVKLRERVFANSPTAAKMNAGPLAHFVNAALGIPIIRQTISGALGVAKERPLPKYATQTLQSWFRSRQSLAPTEGKTVILFDDTYASYHETEMGKAAVNVLEACGFKVRLAKAGCCQRPAISKGFLDQAKEQGAKTLAALDQTGDDSTPILTLEPSCTSSLKSDLPDLIDDPELGARVAKRVMPIEGFLDKEAIMGHIAVDLKAAKAKYLLHGHCHQKALDGTGPLKRLLGGERISEVDSGCCGMAGSFGYEAEHYEISQTIGEDRLFPAVRETPEGHPIIANGFSCRHQIADATGRKPQHFIVWLAEAMGVMEP